MSRYTSHRRGGGNRGGYQRDYQGGYRGRNDSAPQPAEPPKMEFIDWAAIAEESERHEREKWAKLPPIVKEFYQEHKDVKAMSQVEVDQFREKMNKIKVSHFNEKDTRPIPKPIKEFKHAFHNHPDILDQIANQGFQTPSPIQAQAWPILMQGMDLIGIAQTGTGKTLAYLLPALIHIEHQTMPRNERPGPTALILAPTRELAQQIEKETQKYLYRGIRSICIYGGGSRNDQIKHYQSGREIVIATPGRLNDLQQSNIIDLSAVSYLVLDEADRMLDMGFECQIMKVLLDVNPDRQTVMMSATWPPGVRHLALKHMKDPMQIWVGSLDLNAVHSVSQEIIICDDEDKQKMLFDFIQNMGPKDKVIVFCDKKATCSYLSVELTMNGFIVQSIHGDRAQEDREQALADLKTGEARVLVATDVASRGLDIEDITHILNYDFPRNIEEYVHRVGRTGRAGKTGKSITYVTRGDWKHGAELIKILEEANQEVPQQLRAMSDRYAEWKTRRDAENKAYGGGGRRGGGYRGGGGGGGGFRQNRW